LLFGHRKTEQKIEKKNEIEMVKYLSTNDWQGKYQDIAWEERWSGKSSKKFKMVNFKKIENF